MRKLAMALMGVALMATAACNTIRGAGQDVEAAGEAVQETAADASN